MPDIRLVDILIPSPIETFFDWTQRPDGMLDESRELASAISVALGTDARALPDDELPGLDDDDLRGWWGDTDAETIWGGWPIGSKLWLLQRTAIRDIGAQQGVTTALVEQYVRACVQPFIDARIATQMDVTVERSTTDRNAIYTQIVLYRGPLPAMQLRYQALWDEMASDNETQAK